MRLIDIYYKSLLNSRKNVLYNREGKIDLTSIINANSDVDRLESISYKCKIEEDWLINIEKGIEFIDKAIKEERQFITTQGEVVRIEKAKKTTKDTVRHLSKHSDLITHIPEDENSTIVPDKLYIVEKLSDYSVYENRFIYMLLCYLRDFINLRLEKIEDKLTTYNANLYINKDIDINDRNTKIESKIVDVVKHDVFLTKIYKEMPLITRINNVYDTVISLLNTPLMIEVSKAPMIKPPIVATNVLKMNANFKGALALYNYISSYQGDGYSFEEIKTVHSPFEKDMAEDFASAIALFKFATYKYGNNIKDELANQYDKDIKEEEANELKKYDDQVSKLKRKIKETNIGWEEYTIKLEQEIRLLESKVFGIAKLQEKIDFLATRVKVLEQEKENLNEKLILADKKVQEKLDEIMNLNLKFINDLKAFAITSEEEKEKLTEEYLKEKETLVNEFNNKLNALNNDLNDLKDEKEKLIIEERNLKVNYDEEIRLLEIKKNKLINEFNEKIIAIKREHNEQLALKDDDLRKKDYQINQTVLEYEEKIKIIREDMLKQLEDKDKKYIDLLEENNMILASFNALRYKDGLISIEEDYSSRDKFKVLNEQFRLFKKFYDYEWKIAKKKIKNDVEEQAIIDEELEKAKKLDKELDKEIEKAKKKEDSIDKSLEKVLDNVESNEEEKKEKEELVEEDTNKDDE